MMTNTTTVAPPPAAAAGAEDEEDKEVPEPNFENKYPNRNKCAQPEPPESKYKGEPLPDALAKDTIKHLIDKRWIEVWNNQELLKDRTHRMDHSDIFYTMRTMLYRKGYDVSSLDKGNKRKEHYSHIKEYCEYTLKIKRHQIGIFAADRAVMAYQGKTYSVSYENCKDLAVNGVDIICIEKEGIVEKLAPFTDGVGIALVQSQGFVSEYGIMLAKKAKRTGANVMVLTDFDSDGVKIAFELEDVTRIGVDFESIDQINELIEAEIAGEDPFEPELLPLAEASDESIYKPDMKNLEPKLNKILDLNELREGRDSTDTWTSLERLTQGLRRQSPFNSRVIDIEGTPHENHYIDYLETEYGEDGRTYLNFLEKNRIELNTIMTLIGPKRFWNWLYSQIIELFETRDYTRVIPAQPYKITLPIMDKLNSRVEILIDDAIRDEKDVISDELSEVNGLLNTRVKKAQVHERLMDIVDEDEDITKFSEELERLIKSSFKIDVDDVDNNN